MKWNSISGIKPQMLIGPNSFTFSALKSAASLERYVVVLKTTLIFRKFLLLSHMLRCQTCDSPSKCLGFNSGKRLPFSFLHVAVLHWNNVDWHDCPPPGALIQISSHCLQNSIIRVPSILIRDSVLPITWLLDLPFGVFCCCSRLPAQINLGSSKIQSLPNWSPQSALLLLDSYPSSNIQN